MSQQKPRATAEPSLPQRMRDLADAGNEHADELRRCADEFVSAVMAFMDSRRLGSDDPLVSGEPDEATDRMLVTYRAACKAYLEATRPKDGDLTSWKH